MASNKYQHYIPAGHQALFSSATDSSGCVYKYDSQKSIVHSRLQDPRRYGGENHLYSYPDNVVTSNQEKTSLETDFFSQDGEFVRVVKQIIKGEQSSPEDIYQIQKYIAITNNRHPSTINYKRDKRGDLASTIIEEIFALNSRASDMINEFDVKLEIESQESISKVCMLRLIPITHFGPIRSPISV